jgi:hypothetical protein
MRRTIVLAALALAGCESTQAKSARLERAAQSTKAEQGLVVSEQSRDVTVERTTVLQDSYGAAAVVELRNRSASSQVALPLALEVRDGAKERVYANDAPGLDSSLVSVPALAAGERLAWVNDQVTLAGEGRDLRARVGTGAKRGPARLPELEIRGLKTSSDASGDLAVEGEVVNGSDVEQRRLVVFVIGRRGDRIVAAGRAVVERLAPRKSARFSAFPIGDPQGAELSAAAPPTVVAP